MKHKPFAISLIASVSLAGILILSVMAAIPSVKSQEVTGKCELTLSADPSKGSIAVGETLDVKLSGKLTCGGVPVADRGIVISYTPYVPVKTDSSGNYHKDIIIHAPGTFTITTRVSYPLGTEEFLAHASTTIDIKEKPS
jgi:hypothetical protein